MYKAAWHLVSFFALDFKLYTRVLIFFCSKLRTKFVHARQKKILYFWEIIHLLPYERLGLFFEANYQLYDKESDNL